MEGESGRRSHLGCDLQPPAQNTSGGSHLNFLLEFRCIKVIESARHVWVAKAHAMLCPIWLPSIT